jgi:glycosyltransferase involved in cell wall biosynthesis
MEARPHIFATLVGNIERDPGNRIKFGAFFKALSDRFPLADVYNAELAGLARWVNAFQMFTPDMHLWRERFYKNLSAFRQRSQKVATAIERSGHHIDLILQVGVLFDARWREPKIPSLIYTDYTAWLSARRPEAGRSPFNEYQRQQWIALESRALQRAAHICTWSDLVRNSLISDYGLPPERVTIVGGGVNFEQLPQVPQRPLDDRPPTTLFIGKDFHRKGGDVLLLAFAEARKTCPQARLILVTAGPVPPGLPLENVEIVGPIWQRSAIHDLYRQADLFVLPSRLETWGDVLLEAMAYALPCIGVEGQAMEEIIEDQRTGLIVPAEDVNALAAAMVRLFQQPQLRQQWGQAARQRIETSFTWNHVVDRLTPIIQSVYLSSLPQERRSVSRGAQTQ